MKRRHRFCLRWVASSALIWLAVALTSPAAAQTICTTPGPQSCTPAFTDVTQFAAEINAVVQAGLMAGCGGTLFCPYSVVTRGEMAIFLENAKHLGTQHSMPTPTGVFTDVPVGFPLACWVEQLKADGITSGCDPLRYCPDDPVTRRQMAVFLLRTRLGGSYVPTVPCQGTFQADVPCGSQFDVYIEELARRCVTLGCACNPARFCPDESVYRYQMALFFYRMFINPPSCDTPCS